MKSLDPDGPWTRQASQALGTETSLDAYWVTLTAGIEYDTNVRLAPAGEFPDENDWRGVWAIQGGARLFQQDNWSGGIVGAYSGSAHFDLHEFDTNYPVIGAWFDRRFGDKNVPTLLHLDAIHAQRRRDDWRTERHCFKNLGFDAAAKTQWTDDN